MNIKEILDEAYISRAKLYDRMIKRYASHAGYNVQQQVDSEGAGYYLQKTNNGKVWGGR